MDKNFLIMGGGALALVALMSTFFIGDDTAAPAYEPTRTATAPTTNSGSNEVEIEYAKTKLKPSNGPAEADTPKPKEIKREKGLETRAFDSSRTFEVALINPDRDPDKKAKHYLPVSGKIDGKPFVIKVPDYLIAEGGANVSLRVRNLETNATESTSAYFLPELNNLQNRHFLNINSNDVQNVEHQTKPAILPLPGAKFVDQQQ